MFVPREAVSFVSLTPLKVSQRRKKKIFKPSYEFVYQLRLFVSRDWHINFLRVSDDVRVSIEEYVTRSRPIGKRARVARYNNRPCHGFGRHLDE